MSPIRWYVQDALSGLWLSRDVPLSGARVTTGLGASDALRATVEPEFASLKTADGAPLLRPWGAFLYGEENGEIVAGYILSRSDLTGQSWNVEGQGFASYPQGQPFGGTISARNADPLDIVRQLWGWLQSQPDSDLGVELAGTKSNVRVGTGTDATGDPETYELNWWDAPDIGSEIDQLAGDTPFDYREVHLWADETGERVRHVLQLGFPRLGTRRHDLRFVEGENVAEVIGIDRNGDDFANNVLVLGAGEGRRMVRGESGQRDGNLRRTHVVTDKTISVDGRARGVARELLAASLPMPQVTDCVITEHPNAPAGSVAAGDDVLIQARVGWADLEMWHRVEQITHRPDEGIRELTLRRADAYIYAEGPA